MAEITLLLFPRAAPERRPATTIAWQPGYRAQVASEHETQSLSVTLPQRSRAGELLPLAFDLIPIHVFSFLERFRPRFGVPIAIFARIPRQEHLRHVCLHCEFTIAVRDDRTGGAPSFSPNSRAPFLAECDRIWSLDHISLKSRTSSYSDQVYD